MRSQVFKPHIKLMQHTAFTISSGKTERSQTVVFDNNAVLKQHYAPMRAW
jgi:hypothetical protein